MTAHGRRSLLTTIVGIMVVVGAVWLAHRTPRAQHEATVDRPTIPALRWFDGDELERAGGRRWFILRTRGRWQ